MASAVVAYGRYVAVLLHQVLEAFASHGRAFDGRVEVVDVGLVVLAVVDFHGQRVYVRLKGVVRVGKVGEGKHWIGVISV